MPFLCHLNHLGRSKLVTKVTSLLRPKWFAFLIYATQVGYGPF